MANQGAAIRQWSECEDADQLEDVLALLCAARDRIGPVAMRVRQQHRAAHRKQAQPTPLDAHEKAGTSREEIPA